MGGKAEGEEKGEREWGGFGVLGEKREIECAGKD